MAKQTISKTKIKKTVKNYFSSRSSTYQKEDEIISLANSAVEYSLDIWLEGNYGGLDKCVRQEIDNLCIFNQNLMIIKIYYLDNPQSEKTLEDCEIEFYQDIYNICGILIKDYSLKQLLK